MRNLSRTILYILHELLEIAFKSLQTAEFKEESKGLIDVTERNTSSIKTISSYVGLLEEPRQLPEQLDMRSFSVIVSVILKQHSLSHYVLTQSQSISLCLEEIMRAAGTKQKDLRVIWVKRSFLHYFSLKWISRRIGYLEHWQSSINPFLVCHILISTNYQRASTAQNIINALILITNVKKTAAPKSRTVSSVPTASGFALRWIVRWCANALSLVWRAPDYKSLNFCLFFKFLITTSGYAPYFHKK